VEFNLRDLGEKYVLYKENFSIFSGKGERRKREDGKPKQTRNEYGRQKMMS